jgi:translation initiation factor eIF-2B subunit epsilon
MVVRAEDEPLRALILADSCGAVAPTSSPAGAAASAQVLPLHGSSLLHWQLHALSRAGVAEAVVLSSAPVSPPLPKLVGAMAISSLSNSSWRSAGDALRDVESRVALRPSHDFVIVQPGAIFNLNVGQLVAEHKARVESDRNWLVSMVMRRGAAFSPLAIGVESGSGALCYYGDASNLQHVDFDTKAENVGLRYGGTVELLTDVVDIGVDVCSPDLLVEFRENFDFDNVRDYIRAKLDGGEAELLGNRMFAHFVDSSAAQYAISVDCYAAYFVASADIFDGWMSPISAFAVANAVGLACAKSCGNALLFCGDSDGDETSYDDLYPGVKLEDAVIGQDVSIGDGASVWRCVLGDGVKIGSGAKLSNSIVSSNSTISDGAVVTSSLLMASTYVSASSIVPADCFLDTGVAIGGHGFTKLQRSSWVTSSHVRGENGLSDDGADGDDDYMQDDMDSDENEKVAVTGPDWSSAAVGDGGVGRVVEISHRIRHQFLSRNSRGCGWPAFMSAVQSDSEDELEGAAGDESDSEASIEESREYAAEEDNEMAAATARFYHEISDTVERCVEDNVDLDTIALEVNSLKLAYERTFTAARTGVVRGLVDMVLTKQTSGSAPGAWGAISKTFTAWRVLVEKFSSGDTAVLRRGLVDDMAVMLVDDGKMLMYVWRALYEIDVVGEEAILGWVKDARADCAEGSANARLLHDTSVFIDWLEESEEEESEEGEE